MENPKCPYCGRVMARRLHNGLWSYKCPECGALSPECETREAAYAAAMKQDRAIKPLSYREDGLTDFRCKTNDSDLIYRGEVRRILQDQKVVHKERAVNRLTAVNACSVVRGEWVHRKVRHHLPWDCPLYHDEWHCSNCDYEIDDINKEWWNFCPNCGAEMKKEENDERYR